MTMLLRSLLLGFCALLAACASQPGDPESTTRADLQLVARDDGFALVRLKPGQGFPHVAAAYLGGTDRAWQLEEVNAGQGSAGEIVAVPLRPTNSSSVFIDGYRTIPILCYHQFTAGATTKQRLEVSAEAFTEQMQYLKDNDFRVLSFAEISEILAGEQPIPPRAVVLTVDDGYRSVYDVAWPILKEFGYHSTQFIYTDFIGGSKALSWSQIKEMEASGLVDFQSHGKSHTSLSRLPEDSSTKAYKARVRKEVTGAGAVFEKKLGAEPVYLSYPYGNSSDIASRVLQETDYQLAATVTRGNNTVYADRYLLHRTMIYDTHDMAGFRKLINNYKKKNLQ
jgi:peptidoglycan/xylan/chitin deacetylase (PgdA/CDA1 family)